MTGSFAIGFLTISLARWLPHPNARLLLMTGLLGGYTTFSAYSFESLSLWERGGRWNAIADVVGSVLAGLVAVTVGVLVARAVAPFAWRLWEHEWAVPRTPDRYKLMARATDAKGQAQPEKHDHDRRTYMINFVFEVEAEVG